MFKTADQDAIAIAKKVRALVAGKQGEPLDRPWLDRLGAKLSSTDELQEIYDNARLKPFPAYIGVDLHTDLSRFVEGRLELLTRNGFWGLVFVSLSLLVFLHWRISFWVVMGLVLSMMGALICMYLLGITLNLISMFGLIIVIGLLVDDAIIVSEHVYTKMEQGLEPKLAAIQGTEEVTWPVVCAILTTIVGLSSLDHH